MKKALIFQGGWQGHQPKQVADILEGLLRDAEYDVKVTDTLETLEQDDLTTYDLIVPNWTQDKVTQEQLRPLIKAVEQGTGLAGLHGGMADAFRMETEYQFMVGGQWVSHPGNDGVEYVVNIVDREHELTKDMPDFTVSSEQYYMHVDPAIKVHATTRFPVADGPHTPNGTVDMPVVWTKMWGSGKVYYCSLGHVANIVDMPEVRQLMTRGMIWATR